MKHAMIESAPQWALEPPTEHAQLPLPVVADMTTAPKEDSFVAAESRPPVDPWPSAPVVPSTVYTRAAEMLRPIAGKWIPEYRSSGAAVKPALAVPVIPGRPGVVDPVRRPPVGPRHAAEEPLPAPEALDGAPDEAVIDALSRTLIRYERQHPLGNANFKEANSVLHDLLVPAPPSNSRRYEKYQRLHMERLRQAIGLISMLSEGR